MRITRLVLLTCVVSVPAMAEDVSAWAAPEGCKIDRFGQKVFVLDRNQTVEQFKKASQVWDGSKRAVSLAGARGETLAFQVCIEGGRNGLEGVNMAVGYLIGTEEKPGAGNKLPASVARLYKMYYTEVSDKGSGPTNSPTMGKGWYPDALVPWDVADADGYDGPPFAVKAGEIQGVWIDVEIPYGTAADTYGGVITITAKDRPELRLALALKVRRFDIPRTIHNTFFMNFGMDDLNQAGGFWLKGQKIARYEDEVYRQARRHRFTAGNMYDNERPVIRESPEGLQSVDWKAYDAHFDKVLNPKTNVFGPGEEAIEIWKAPLSGMLGAQWPRNDKAWDQMVVEIKKHWKEKGWDLSRAYVYLADEPGKDKAQKLNELAGRIKASEGPNLRRQIAVYTILGNTWEGQKWVFDLWKDNLDMWMVAGDYWSVQSMKALPQGCLRGMYQGGEPYQGNEPLDADGVAMRTWSWVAWQYRLDYQCYYSMCEAWRGLKKGQDRNNCEIWDSPRNRPWAISQGVFIYPGKKVNYDLPIVNIRMKQIRRGQTDYEYFWMLREVGEGELADRLCKRVLNVALSEAADAPEKYGYGKWSHNPLDWDAAIKEAADALEKVADRLPKEPGGSRDGVR